jgi:hypothetical protein
MARRGPRLHVRRLGLRLQPLHPLPLSLPPHHEPLLVLRREPLRPEPLRDRRRLLRQPPKPR